ncbi:DUF6869 domain-containing protein [Methylophilus methylotrophus]|uniref:DUF6869 domain-containing protein n=1 Tax=Methylophilus methylotrophus TaxID=17 RepID=UPI000F59F404|nr:hypothetical protein [Methylophilus methylotrophus]
METRQPFEIAEEWIQKWSAHEITAIDPGMESALDGELPLEQPALCLAAILEILRHVDGSKPSHLLSVLAAGPLENLLNYNGDAVVDEVDSLARSNPEFRLLLNGVWDSDIKPSIIARLAKYRGNPW